MVFGLALPLLLLACFELLLRLTGWGASLPQEDPFVGFESNFPLFEKVVDASGTAFYQTRPAKLKYFNDQRFPVEKPPHTLRIFALGGSTTFGRPYDWQTAFPRWLSLLLKQSLPSQNFEVINAGGVSYASYRVSVLMKELLQYQPDAFILYSGHNEFLEERSYGDLMNEAGPLRAVKKGLARLRTVNLLRRGLGFSTAATPKMLLKDDIRAKLDVWEGMASYTRNDSLRTQILQHYAYNLESMILMAQRADVPLILVDPPANIKDFSPFKSEHGPRFSEEGKALFDELLESGNRLNEQGRYREAVAAYEQALAMDEAYAELHFRLASSLMALGDRERARRHFSAALDLDICPLRILPPMHDILRRTAARHKVPFLDFVQILQNRSRNLLGHDILGSSFFLDHVHLNMEVHQLLAESLLDLCIQRGLIHPARTLSEPQRQALYQEVLDGLDPAYYAQRDLNLAKVLGWAGKTEEAALALNRSRKILQGDARMHFNMGVLLEKQHRPREALAEYEAALKLEDDFFEAQFNAGKTLQQLERFEEAESAFAKAWELQPDSAETAYNLVRCLLQNRKFGPALTALERARRLDPEYPGVFWLSAEIYRALDRREEAEAAYALYAERHPDKASAYYYLGLARGRNDKLEGALAAFSRAVQLDDRFSEAYRNMALIYEIQGRDAEAEAAFERAVATQPEDYLPLFQLAVFHHKRKHFDQAVSLYRRAIVQNPQHLPAHTNLGSALAEMGDFDSALPVFREIAGRWPENADAHFRLAQLELMRNHFPEAAAHLKRAMSLGLEAPPEMKSQLAEYLE